MRRVAAIVRFVKPCVVVGVSSLVLAIACGGKETAPGQSCGAFFDDLTAMFAQCGDPERLNPSSRSAFVDYCNALATAPGAGDLASQYDACAKTLDPNVCGGPQCAPRGTLAPGAACTDGAQCLSGFCAPNAQAKPTTEQSCGTCLGLVEQGGSCNGSTPCDVYAGLYCGAAGTCVSVVSQGGSCANAGCAGELFCESQTKTCQPLLTKGQACESACMAAFACIAGVCADRVAAGAPCPTGNECKLDLVCDPQTNVCVTGAAAGQACDTSKLVQCAAGLLCVAGACEAPKLEGEACVLGHFECASDLVCANGTCQLPDFTLCK